MKILTVLCGVFGTATVTFFYFACFLHNRVASDCVAAGYVSAMMALLFGAIVLNRVMND